MKDRVFRDPVHGLIEFRGDDRPLDGLLATRAFQRLRRVHQMGFAWHVYPGAEHSRFGHALGAFHVAVRATQALQLTPTIAFHVRVAALLHDIGHGPFSHTWEQVFPETSHEEWGKRVCTEDEEFRGALDQIDDGLSAHLCAFWDKTYKPSYARKLVSSQLDVDRLDYLLRDGHYSGAGYATFDLDWILHALQIESVRDGDDPRDLVVDYRRGRFAVEQYLFARTYMYAQVYHHKTVRAAEWMFLKLFERYVALAKEGNEPPGLPAAAGLARGTRVSVGQYLGLDDFAVTCAMDAWADPSAGATRDRVVQDLAQRLVSRRLFKTVDLGDDPAVMEDLRAPLAKVAAKEFGEDGSYYYHLDTAQQVGYRADGEELHVVGHPHRGTVTLGRLLEELPLGQHQAVRLLYAPELSEAVLPIVARTLGHDPH